MCGIRIRVPSAVLAVVAGAWLAAPASAQEPSEAAPAAQTASQDSSTLRDRIQEYIARARIDDQTSEEGFYPRFGGFPAGGGISGGAGYRQYVLRAPILADVSAVLSTKLYKGFDAKIRWIQAWTNRVDVWTEFRYRDYPQEDFYGIGRLAPRSSRTDYSLESTDVVARATIRARRWLSLGGDIGYYNPRIGPGTDDSFPSTASLFGDAQAPGLVSQPRFLHGSVFAEIDSRDYRGNPHRGGFYRAALGQWDDRTIGQYDFRRIDAEAAHFIPVAPTHVIALHAETTHVRSATGQLVPFYALPYVGGGRTIRSYQEYRFRDQNVLAANAEYRWVPRPFLHFAAFVDVGDVAGTWSALDLGRMKHGYGVGIRAGTPNRTIARIDVATGGGEGWRVFLKFSPAF